MLYWTAVRSESRSRSSVSAVADCSPELPLTHESSIKSVANSAARIANLRQADLWEKIQTIGSSRNQKGSGARHRRVAAPLPRAAAERGVRCRKATTRGLAGCRRARPAPRYSLRNLSGRDIARAIGPGSAAAPGQNHDLLRAAA